MASSTSSNTAQLTEADEPHALSRVTAISQCRYNEESRTLTLRGWIADGDGITQLRFLAPGDRLLGYGSLSIVRTDVLRQYGTENMAANGFQAVVECGMRVGDKVTVEFISENGKVFGSHSARASESEAFAIEQLVYDTPSKQIFYEGYFIPSRQIRGLSITLSRGRSEPVDNIFLLRKDLSQRLLESNNIYPGFSGRIFHAGQGDLNSAALVAHYVNGEDKIFPIPIDRVAYDTPHASVEMLELDWLAGKIKIRGWYRTFQEVTRIQLSVAGQICHVIPVIKISDTITRENKFRGPAVKEFTVEASLTNVFERLERVCENGSIEVSMTLFNKDSTLLDRTFSARTTIVRKGRVSYCVFDKRNSVLALQGQYVGHAKPATLQVLGNGLPFGQPLPVQASTDNGEAMPGVHVGEWSWTHDINAAVGAATRISVRLFDDQGLLVGEVDAAEQRPVIVNGHEIVDAADVEAQAALQHAHNVVDRVLPHNTVLFTLQSSISLLYGGGAVRILDLMRFFHEAGYNVVLIDRTAAWEIARRPAAYRQMREYVDQHLMVPQALKNQVLSLLLNDLEKSASPDPLDRKLIEKMKEVQKKGRLMLSDSKILAEKADTHFNYACTALANRLNPRVAISSYAWSAEFHQALRPSIYGMIDTVDIQNLRYESFRAAAADFGEEAVPNIDRHKVTEAEELKFLALAQGLITISKQEQEWLAARVGAHRVVTAGVSMADGAHGNRPARVSTAAQIVLFVGNLYEPNSFSMRRFIKEQWGVVQDAMPQATLLICGRVGEALSDLASESVRIAGVVDDLRGVYRDASLAINPVLFGSGLPVKTIEGLSFGKAMVCTEFGARGLEDAVKKGAIKTGSFDELGAQIVYLLQNNDIRVKAEQAARGFVKKSLAVDVVMADLMNFIESKIFYNPS